MDSSGAEGRFGAGVYGLRTNHRESYSLEELATVFQAEVLAVLECANTLTLVKATNRNILICSDSRAAINALAKTTTESSVVWDCMLTLNRLGESNRITVVWVPGHQGIHGNEVADGLAKLGTLEIPARQIVGVPHRQKTHQRVSETGTSGFVGPGSGLSSSQVIAEPTPL